MDESREDVREIVRAVVEEFVRAEKEKAEPGYQAELTEERKRRESLEQRVNDLIAENSRTKVAAEEAERGAAIRVELQRLGVGKIDLAFRAVQEDIVRREDGKLAARDGSDLQEYLARFAAENPELLPARLAGGSGATGGRRGAPAGGGVDLERIRPGMSAEELERVRQEIARVAFQTLRGV